MNRFRLTTTRLVIAAGWVAASGMTVVAGVRLIRSETQPLLIGIQGIAGWLLLPAYPLALLSLLRRRHVLGSVAVALSITQAGLALTAVSWSGSHPAPHGATTIRLVTANVLVDNTEMVALGDQLAGADADVVVLQEVSAEHLEDLRRSTVWDAYPYRILDPHPGFLGSAILSRLPVIAGRAFDVAGFPMTRADVETAAGPVRIVDVHTVAPVSTVNAVNWTAQLEHLAELQAPPGSALILAGDFNATLDHPPMQRLIESGLRDAFVEAGTGFGATWPQWSGPVFPVMRLDHVLVSQQITVVSIETAGNRGSDHRMVITDLALPPLT